VGEEAKKALSLQEFQLEYNLPNWNEIDQVLYLSAKLATVSGLDLLEEFKSCVYQGITPPSNLLVAMAENIDNYLANDSKKMTLDYAFSVQSKQKVGSAKSAAAAKSKLSFLYGEMYKLRKSRKISTWNAAEAVIGDLETPTVETLDRYYRRKNVESLFDQMNADAIDAIEFLSEARRDDKRNPDK
jgi:hypothetical protein